MLSEAEQRRLTEIEVTLRADDPVFVRRFDERERSQPRRRWYGLVAVLIVMVAAAVVVTGLMASSVATVVVALTAVGAGAGMWVTDRFGR